MLRFSLIGAAVVTLTGCELRPVLKSASALRLGEFDVIRIDISTSDVEEIKRRQINFYVIVSECASGDERSAIDAKIHGLRVAEFRYPTIGKVTTVEGVMSHSMFDRYRNPCAMLEGGGYFTGTLRTDPVEILRNIENPGVRAELK